MNRKVTLASLAERLAEICNIPAAEAESRIKSYFDIIAETISAGDSVKVKGLGTFKAVGIEPRESVDVTTGKRMLIPGHRRAVFTPEKSLAEKVNAPFAAFEAVELSDDISEEELDAAAQEETVAAVPEESVVTSEVEPTADAQETPEETIEEPATASVEEEEKPVEASEPEPEPEPELPVEVKEEKVSEAAAARPTFGIQPPSIEEDDDFDIGRDYNPRRQRHRGGFLPGFLIGFACIFVVLGGLWCWYRFAPESFDSILGRPSAKVENATPAKIVSNTVPATKPDAQAQKVESEAPEEADAVAEVSVEKEEAENSAEVPTQPSDKAKEKPVYDTISKTRFLTTMARDHYGSYHLWPYIYEENKAILGHPDRIKPGTKVVIPPAEKYGINAKDKACIAKAKKLGVEIYAKYK